MALDAYVREVALVQMQQVHCDIERVVTRTTLLDFRCLQRSQVLVGWPLRIATLVQLAVVAYLAKFPSYECFRLKVANVGGRENSRRALLQGDVEAAQVTRLI